MKLTLVVAFHVGNFPQKRKEFALSKPGTDLRIAQLKGKCLCEQNLHLVKRRTIMIGLKSVTYFR